MATVRTSSRFTLLDIEDGEEYLEDFAAFYYPPEYPDHLVSKMIRKGRLRLCTRSIVFEPEQNQYPLLRIAFKDTEKVARVALPPTSGITAELCVVASRAVTKIKENNIIAPYAVEKA